MTVRMVCGYRTMSHEAATVLAGLLPIELLAQFQSEAYWRIRDWALGGGRIPDRARAEVKHQARRCALRKWQHSMEFPTCGHRVVEAIRPQLPQWLDRR